MATPQSVIHGTTSPRAALVPAALLGLAMLLLWELPAVAASHGGFAFLGAWSLALVVLGLPLALAELLMGRRSRRAPLEGLAVLTREADARRGWRFAAWGGAFAVVLALAALALMAGGTVNFMARQAGLPGGATVAPALPLGTGGLLLLAAGLALLPPARRGLVLLAGLALVLALLAVAAVPGAAMAPVAYPSHALTAGDWREAFRQALLTLGGGLGVLWLVGMRLDKEAPLARVALGFLGLQVVLAVLLMLALAPFVAARLANAGGGADIIPVGPGVWVVLCTVLLAALFGLVQVAEPVLLRLAERGMARLPAVVLVFVGSAVLAEAAWLVGQQTGLLALLVLLYLLLAAVLACLSVFAGWGMKISHARKELALPAEGLYNLWRVAVRLAVPLLILWVLLQPLLG